MTIPASTECGPAVATLECPDCHAEWEAWGIADSEGEFTPYTRSDGYCTCGTRGQVQGALRVVGDDPDRWMEIEWERRHFRD